MHARVFENHVCYVKMFTHKINNSTVEAMYLGHLRFYISWPTYSLQRANLTKSVQELLIYSIIL